MKYPVFLAALKTLSPEWREEYRFHPSRRWRFDFALPGRRFAIEVDGGVWSGGRHSGGAGQLRDMEKMNNAAILGWTVLHFTPQQVRSSYGVHVVRLLMERESPTN